MTLCYNQNIHRLKGGYRYSEDVKLFAAYMRMLSGPLGYETFEANAQHSVPSLSCIDKYIAKVESCAVEGVLRIQELCEYLTAMKLPKIVALSEDATRINNHIQYDSRTNTIVGCVLPFDENGMPITGLHQARSAAEIESSFYDTTTGQGKKRSSYVNTVMAQPLIPGSPAFCLLLCGTDSKYTSSDIKRRWKFISDQLEKKGIKVLSFASDSDPKFNAVMRSHLTLGQSIENNMGFPSWFNANIGSSNGYFPIQDTVHIGTKFRNRMLNSPLKMGKNEITEKHLAKLIEMFPKEYHGLCPFTVKPKDRQNFDSVLRLCDDKVIELLCHVEGSEGTALYLKILSNILRSFLDSRLTPKERLRYIWFSNFLLRIWKTFISQSKKKYTTDNFISQNCHYCVEINAHSLVYLMLYLREQNLDYLFHPEFFGSQQCESFFRQIRSLSSTYSTVTNCTLLGIIRRISKIELQNQISHIKLKHFKFPRIGLESSSYYLRVDRNGLSHGDRSKRLPNKNEIINEIELAKIEAIEYADSLGMRLKAPFDYSCSFPVPKFENDQRPGHVDLNVKPTEVPNRTNDSQLLYNRNFKQYAEKKIDTNRITETSPFVKVKDKSGESVYVKKCTLCWLFEKSTKKLSSDRLRRVMTKTD